MVRTKAGENVNTQRAVGRQLSQPEWILALANEAAHEKRTTTFRFGEKSW